ncbi:MAG: hypothetical protein ACYT04_35165 [Nostoc sp.]
MDISHPVAIDDIYIDVNILEEIASLQYLEITDLQNLDRKEFDRFGLGEADEKQIAGTQVVERYSKIRVRIVLEWNSQQSESERPSGDEDE